MRTELEDIAEEAATVIFNATGTKKALTDRDRYRIARHVAFKIMLPKIETEEKETNSN